MKSLAKSSFAVYPSYTVTAAMTQPTGLDLFCKSVVPRARASSEAVIIWTDGSGIYTNGSGGWAFTVSYKGAKREFYGFDEDTTNNAMELTAIIRALECLRPETKQPVLIHSDSMYSINALTKWHVDWAAQGWKTATGGAVKNRELIERGIELIRLHGAFRRIEFVHVKGHSGIHENEFVDRLASRARTHKESNWTVPEWVKVSVAGLAAKAA